MSQQRRGAKRQSGFIIFSQRHLFAIYSRGLKTTSRANAALAFDVALLTHPTHDASSFVIRALLKTFKQIVGFFGAPARRLIEWLAPPQTPQILLIYADSRRRIATSRVVCAAKLATRTAIDDEDLNKRKLTFLPGFLLPRIGFYFYI